MLNIKELEEMGKKAGFSHVALLKSDSIELMPEVKSKKSGASDDPDDSHEDKKITTKIIQEQPHATSTAAAADNKT